MTNRDILHKSLGELVTGDYMLLDLPYFANVGDVMIWQAAVDLLRDVPYKCLYSCSIETYHKPQLSSDVVILFMGGGNFGDLWGRHQEFRHRVMNDFPENKIIQLPQSVCFNDEEYMKRDVAVWEQHRGDVVVCLRDEKSKAIIDNNYTNVKTLLLPDMALAFDVNGYCAEHSLKTGRGHGALFVKRNDSEKAMDDGEKLPDATVADWPSMVKTPKAMYVFWLVRRLVKSLGADSDKFTDWCWRKWLKDVMLKSGIRFVAQYETVYSTRLHTAVLAMLLGKRVEMIDNSYGKCRGVYDLWLSGEPNIEMR